MQKEKLFLALDTAYQKGCVTLFLGEETIYSVTLQEKMAHGKAVCHALQQSFIFCEQNNYTLDALFVGVGPGSFIGLRIALATALGVSFARQLPLVGFCSHLALACSINDDVDHFYVCMKASGQLNYVTEFHNKNSITVNKDSTKIITATQLHEHIDKGAYVYSDVVEQLSHHIFENKLISLYGPTALGVQKAALQKLYAVGGVISDESKYIKPNYIKSPNVSLPKTSFVINSHVA